MSFKARLHRAGYKVSILRDFLRDCQLYLQHCRSFRLEDDPDDAGAKIMILAHALEKGLCMPQPKRGFGEVKAVELALLLQKFYDKIPQSVQITGASCLVAYLNHHAQSGYTSEFLTRVSSILDSFHLDSNIPIAGAILRASSDYPPRLFSDFRSFLSTRHSIRDYSEIFASEDDAALLDAIRDTGMTPSQCNRQASKIHLVKDRDLIGKLLSVQGGASGFVQKVPRLAIVTNDIGGWDGEDQRNQCWIDGSLFAMTFLLALHGRGLAACPLNLAKSMADESKIKALANIPSFERTIMMVSIGRYPESYKTAVSLRRPLEDYCVIHDKRLS